MKRVVEVKIEFLNTDFSFCILDMHVKLYICFQKFFLSRHARLPRIYAVFEIF